MNSNIFEEKKRKILQTFKEKNFEEVIAAGEKLLSQKKDDAQLIYLLALASINIQKFSKAEEYIDNLLSYKETDQLYFVKGNIQKKLKRFHAAIKSFEKSIELNPSFSEAYNNLGNTKKILNQQEKAIECFKKAINLKPDNFQALFNLSSIYKENNNYNELILVYEKILQLDKNNIKTLYNLGSAHLFLGNFSKGKEYFKKIFQLDKTHIPSIRNYILVTKIDKNDEIFDYIKNINIQNLNQEEKILLTNALSKGYFDLGNEEHGLKNLTAANLIKRKNSNFSLEEEKKRFENIKNFFSTTQNYNLNFDDKYFSKPVFILGMPRSGTTLLEQILSTHSKIYGAGELYFLQKKINELGFEKKNEFKNLFSEIRKFYYQNISKISNKPFIIDKFPVNFRWIGFIVNALPEAKIIHIHRNPMAVCWSNYKTLFIDSVMDFSLDQEDLASYYSLYNDLMNFWLTKYDDKILNVYYEDFVKDFELHTKKILLFLNLDWEEHLKYYEKSDRVVTTASFEQVRNKIKKDTSKQWEKFSDYLEPMQKILNSNKIKF